MLLNGKKLEGYSLRASDREIGKVKDMYFDDRQWRIRYVVVDTGEWLPGRKVLISPPCFGAPDFEHRMLPVALSGTQVEASPSIETNKPITVEYEEALHTYYNWPFYWTGSNYPAGIYGGLGGAVPVVPVTADDASTPGDMKPPPTPEEKTKNLSADDRHLQSVDEVRGWNIKALDGDIGHVEDLLVRPSRDWSIGQIVIDTRNWLPGRKVLVAPHWVKQVDWQEKEIHINLDRDTIESAPEYDADRQLDPAYENELQAHYQSSPKLV